MPVSFARLRRDKEEHITVSFQNSSPIVGFDQALVLLVENDGAQDGWETITRDESVGGFRLKVIDFQNASFPGGVNTSGAEDDVGVNGRPRRISLVNMNRVGAWTVTRFRFSPLHPDTPPVLEFYAVIAVVAVAANKPVAQLGDLIITPVLNVDV